MSRLCSPSSHKTFIWTFLLLLSFFAFLKALGLIFSFIPIVFVLGVKEKFCGFVNILTAPIGITEHFISLLTLVCEIDRFIFFLFNFIVSGPVIVIGDVIKVDKFPSELNINEPLLELEDNKALLEPDEDELLLELDED